MTKSTEHASPDSKRLFAWLWRSYLSRFKLPLAIAVSIMAIEGSALGLLSLMIEPMFDRIFVGKDQGAIAWVGLGILGIFIVRAIASMAHKILLTRIAQRTAAAIRSDLLRHLMTLDTSFHQAKSPGELIERVQGDVTAINSIWATIATGLGRDLVALLWLFGVALSIDWRWTAVALVGAPLLIIPSFIVQRYVRTSARRARGLASQMATRLDEVFHGINPIKLNGLEGYQARRDAALVRQRIDAEVKTAAGQSAIPGLLDVMSGIGFLCVLIYGGAEIIAGDKTVGQFMSFFTAIGLAFDPMRRLGQLSGAWQSAAASIERILGILSLRPVITSPATPAKSPAGAAPEVRLEGVELAYGDMAVLRGIDLVAEAGQTTALVGASGAGKSTIFNVLTRLVDPAAGRVTIGGVPAKDMDLADLRAMFSTVSQDAALFDETLRENILFGREDISDERLDEVLRAAHVADFLPNLSDGLQSPAGPRGSNLSGGQRQRVAIARALLRDTPILLLDEATSALDTRSEQIVQDALDRLSKGRTTLVIAHRLSTVRNAHKIVVMEQGRIVDQGRHEELLERGGLYSELYRLQFEKSA
ncbi:ABC transporter ATP-binding protein [Pelagovum pacificum]|uniref:ABC transporter ATP-binding protein n=1 Tax=Pelagovum pacificum TaxID=2588711 RepID=A0A5C5GA37_9RHOB|nr:ABC transporter ATP-binding protein [Pelagovum pacificum]QQA41550.1 ABC transporter ATP-binding protein [Pelagovum pacificum]TNY30830.1 ABC transporter ATP-binding protein [Pelagovum pacificum]